jgi:hypothetical protein
LRMRNRGNRRGGNKLRMSKRGNLNVKAIEKEKREQKGESK